MFPRLDFWGFVKMLSPLSRRSYYCGNFCVLVAVDNDLVRSLSMRHSYILFISQKSLIGFAEISPIIYRSIHNKLPQMIFRLVEKSRFEARQIFFSVVSALRRDRERASCVVSIGSNRSSWERARTYIREMLLLFQKQWSRYTWKWWWFHFRSFTELEMKRAAISASSLSWYSCLLILLFYLQNFTFYREKSHGSQVWTGLSAVFSSTVNGPDPLSSTQRSSRGRILLRVPRLIRSTTRAQ